MSFSQLQGVGGVGVGVGVGQTNNNNTANHFSQQQQQHNQQSTHNPPTAHNQHLQPHHQQQQQQQSAFQNNLFPVGAFPDQSGPSLGVASSYIQPNYNSHSQFQQQHQQGQFMPDFNNNNASMNLNMNMNMNMNQFQSGQQSQQSNSNPTPMQMSMMNNLARFQGQQPQSQSQQQFNLNNSQGQGQTQGQGQQQQQQPMSLMPFNNAGSLNNGMGNATGLSLMAPPSVNPMVNMANGNPGMPLGNPTNAMRAYQAQLQAQASLMNQNAMNQSQSNSPANSHIQPPSRQGSVLMPQTPVNAGQTPGQGQPQGQGQAQTNTQNALQQQKRAASRPSTGSSMPQNTTQPSSTDATTTDDTTTSNTNTNGTGLSSTEAQRVALLFEINTILFKEVLALQAAGRTGPPKPENTPDDPTKPKTTASKEYVECMRRIGANLSYLAASANPEFKKAESACPTVAETIPQIPGNAMSQTSLDDLNDKYAKLLNLWPEYKQTGFPKNLGPPNAALVAGNPQMQQAMLAQAQAQQTSQGVSTNGMKVPAAPVQR